jgi:alpha-beta hydrolase superfamily lysophospholipase
MNYHLNIVTIFKLLISTLQLLSISILLGGCSGLFFYPSQEQSITPEQYQRPFQNIYFSTPDHEKLHAWWLPVEKPHQRKGTIYYLHGNAGNISTHLKQVVWLTQQGYQVFLLDYRGYGKSSGTPILPDVFIDIKSGFKKLQQLLAQQQSSHSVIKKEPVFILGQSLGASMAGYVVATSPEIKQQLNGIILDSPFSGYSGITQEIAEKHWSTWLFQYPAKWLMPDNYDLVDHIQKLAPLPLLLLHSNEDKIISLEHSKKLLRKAQQPKQLYIYQERHIGALLLPKHQEYVLRYLATHSK